MPRPEPLTIEALYTPCDTSRLPFKDSAELEEFDGVIGQPRALGAIHFGTGIARDGFNIFAMGSSGTGRFTIVKRILEQQAAKRDAPSDWCYVYNFKRPHKPKALRLPAGHGVTLRDDMEQLIEDLGSAIPSAFETEEYHSRIEKLEQELNERRDNALNELGTEAGEHNVRFLHTPAGFAFAPLDKKGEVIRPESFEKLSQEEKQRIEKIVEDLQKRLQRIIRQIPIWQKETREKIKELDREIGRYAVDHLIGLIKDRHKNLPEVMTYLDDVERDIVEHVRDFRGESESQATLLGISPKPDALNRYNVNVIIDHDREQAAPVVYQDLPTHSNMVGRVEYRAQMGTLVTDFMLIKSGDLHQANGGYLILDAIRVLTQPFAWDSLKRALRSREIRIEPLEKALGFMSTVSLEPEPIPLDVKVVLIGERLLYYLLCEYDPEFSDLFKVAADFDERMDRDQDSDLQFARLVGRIASQESLLALDQSAVARIIEHSSRLAEDTEKLSIHMREIVDIIQEADFRARQDEQQVISRQHVQQAIDDKIYRLDRIREHIYESIRRGTLKIDTKDAKVGQINGLSVIDLGGFSFGQPARITATTRLGTGKVIDIQRETELGGNVHSKGVLILSNYLASHYAKGHPLSMSASLVFEQSYGLVEGDSASLAELCALLSALSGVAIKQSFAVTGSINQLGEVQAIGGVNQKIEGFFDICRATELTREQAVLIPRSNVPHLMLRQDVVAAVERSEFRVYAVDNVDEAITLLTGVPAGARDQKGEYPSESVNGRVEKALIDLAIRRKEYAREHEDREQQ